MKKWMLVVVLVLVAVSMTACGRGSGGSEMVAEQTDPNCKSGTTVYNVPVDENGSRDEVNAYTVRPNPDCGLPPLYCIYSVAKEYNGYNGGPSCVLLDQDQE